MIQALDDLRKPVLAVDVPSGLAADSGASTGAVLRARCTITYIGVNRGLLTGIGPVCTGELLFDDLGVEARVHDAIAAPVWRPAPADLARWLPRRAPDGYKKTYGHVLVIGGDHGFGGAPMMTAQGPAMPAPGWSAWPPGASTWRRCWRVSRRSWPGRWTAWRIWRRCWSRPRWWRWARAWAGTPGAGPCWKRPWTAACPWWWTPMP